MPSQPGPTNPVVRTVATLALTLTTLAAPLAAAPANAHTVDIAAAPTMTVAASPMPQTGTLSARKRAKQAKRAKQLPQPPIAPTPTPSPTDPTDPHDHSHDPVVPVIEDYGRYQGQVSCDPTNKSGVVATRTLLMSMFGGRDLGTVRSCHIGGMSEHKEGRAWDWGLNAYDKNEAKIAEQGIDWLLEEVDGYPAARARRLGIQYIIWNRKMWRAYDPGAGWKRYTGASPHTDHVHFSFTWNGASGLNSYWTGTVQPHDYGPCITHQGVLAKPWTRPNPEPCPTPRRTPVANQQGYYVAQTGDTIRKIARYFNTRGRKIRRWNSLPLKGKVYIFEDQLLRVRRR